MGLDAPVFAIPPGLEVTVYEVMGLPPLEAGAAKLTVASVFPAVAATPVGASGTVTRVQLPKTSTVIAVAWVSVVSAEVSARRPVVWLWTVKVMVASKPGELPEAFGPGTAPNEKAPKVAFPATLSMMGSRATAVLPVLARKPPKEICDLSAILTVAGL